MNLVKTLKALFGGANSTPPPRQPLPPPEPDAEEVNVPEITVPEALAALAQSPAPLLLDVREPYEWRQVQIADSLHIPMNEIPQRLAELPTDRELIVLCAHGSRSYGMAHYLIEQGYTARSLAGGITQWHVQGGAVVVGKS
jgi:rhodanese-related sulfurtransferase